MESGFEPKTGRLQSPGSCRCSLGCLPGPSSPVCDPLWSFLTTLQPCYIFFPLGNHLKDISSLGPWHMLFLSLEHWIPPQPGASSLIPLPWGSLSPSLTLVSWRRLLGLSSLPSCYHVSLFVVICQFYLQAMRLVGGGRGWKGWVFSHSWIPSSFPGSSLGKESTCNAGDPGLIPGLGRSPERGHGIQYSCMENPHGQRCLAGYSPWGHKESGTTERLSAAQLDPQYSGQEAPHVFSLSSGAQFCPCQLCEPLWYISVSCS